MLSLQGIDTSTLNWSAIVIHALEIIAFLSQIVLFRTVQVILKQYRMVDEIIVKTFM